ncbi:MAG: chemotaxis response regulator protein-glutamate methylesterase [Candidatus Delongbacteria bacterium]
MRGIRILVVDDSAVVRRLLTRIIEEEPGLEVAGQASNGRLALDMLDQVEPDLVTLDVEMPVMDGLATLAELRRRRPRLPVIMFSTLTSRGAATTIEALSAGASDYLTKPEGAANLQESLERLRADLVPRVRALARIRPAQPVHTVKEPAMSTSPQPRPTTDPFPRTAPAFPREARPGLERSALRTPAPGRPIPRPPMPNVIPAAGPARHLARPAELLVVGVSTGGPNALARVMPLFPATLSVPVLIVQHMPPLFTRMLADRLDQLSPLTVREARNGSVLLPGEAWLAQGDWHMEVAREGGRLVLREHQGPQVNSCRPAVDVLFDSAVRCCGGAVLAMVLTGMGQDGMKGARAIREAGGLVLAQDEESSVVWGMPGAVAMAGLADAVLPLDGLVPHALQLLTSIRPLGGRSSACR